VGIFHPVVSISDVQIVHQKHWLLGGR
jgi:hypothetical protein